MSESEAQSHAVKSLLVSPNRLSLGESNQVARAVSMDARPVLEYLDSLNANGNCSLVEIRLAAILRGILIHLQAEPELKGGP